MSNREFTDGTYSRRRKNEKEKGLLRNYEEPKSILHESCFFVNKSITSNAIVPHLYDCDKLHAIFQLSSVGGS